MYTILLQKKKYITIDEMHFDTLGGKQFFNRALKPYFHQKTWLNYILHLKICTVTASFSCSGVRAWQISDNFPIDNDDDC